MRFEIEAKLRVDSLREIAGRLTEVGAEFLEERLEKDCYFDQADGSFTRTDRCLRLRRQTVGRNEKVFLTYKGAKEKDQFKKRREIEIEVNDADCATELLVWLGYKKSLVFEKRRRVWRLGGCQVALDELPLLGSFVEIEGLDDEEITKVQEVLGLTVLPHIGEGYAVLMAQKLRELGRDGGEELLLEQEGS